VAGEGDGEVGDGDVGGVIEAASPFFAEAELGADFGGLLLVGVWCGLLLVGVWCGLLLVGVWCG
jgi:hypothetical protein